MGQAGLGGSPGAAGQPSQYYQTGSSGAGGSSDRCVVTRADIEGPFFSSGSPERTNLREAGLAGQLLLVRGRVLDPSCAPLSGALLDFWQANDAGAYDNQGFRLRGHQITDSSGRFEMRTIVPGRYLNGNQFRPAHLHVKVAVGGGELLTTQLYFEGDPFNGVDPWFSEATMLRPRLEGNELAADYDFTVRA